MIEKYDIHVATEGAGSSREELHKTLVAIGFKDDHLAERGLIFNKETAAYYAACPLIDIHMSMKIPTQKELGPVEEQVHAAMAAATVPGYWHSEFVEWDVRLQPFRSFRLAPFFCEPLVSRPRLEAKVWDLHLAFCEDDLIPALKDCLIENGLYYLARKKVREGTEKRYAIFTVQGTNRPQEGHRFVKELVFWLGSVGASACDVKLEITTKMELYRDPSVVPPTITEIVWR